MSSGEETLQEIQKALAPYVRPREEVAQIRRILALHLDSCLENGSARAPLALVESSGASISSELRGFRKEYLKALNANIRARKEHDQIREAAQRTQDTADSGAEQSTAGGHLEAHLANLRLRQKQERLLAVEKYLDLLGEKPAASPDFLNPKSIFRDTRPLPDVPKEVVDGLTLDQAAGKTDLKSLTDQLEKQVLRAKLLLRREEQLLEDVKARSSARPETISQNAKLDALNTTRTELIGWIETELGKASSDGGDETGTSLTQLRHDAGGVDMSAQVAGVKDKYARYLAARKALLQLATQQLHPTIKPPPLEPSELRTTYTATPTPVTHLLTPYLDSLLSVAREQKALIGQKSHFNIAIAKQLKENCRALDHLAEESQLLLAHHHAADTSRSGLGDSLVEALDATGRVKPWVLAAESAKIATLEAVAEKIEEGQIALEGSMRTLGEIDELLGRRGLAAQRGEGAAGGEQQGNTTEDDIWLAEGQKTPARKNAEKRKSKAEMSGDIWDILHGNLGLLRAEDEDT